jgi:hypothetical protein
MAIEDAAVNLTTIAIIISISVGIITIWATFRNIKNEAKKSNDILNTLLSKNFEDLKDRVNFLNNKRVEMQIRFDAMVKVLDRLEQFSYGRSSKSEPPYMHGDTETMNHRNKDEEGLFKED